ncbi:MAG: hypothetical protein AAGE59_30490 [Cyanobacteria bacterium P01_F01_bin.86]
MAETDATSIRQSELHDRLVIDIETTEELGNLAHFLVDVRHHQVEGFVCRSGFLGRDKTPVMWVQVESVGQDSILVRRSGSTITARFDAALVIDGQAVWTNTGNNVGHLADYCLNLQTGAITRYIFTAPGWQGLKEGLYSFDPAAVVSAGRKRMMVQQTALENAPQFLPGVQDRVAGVLQQDVERTREDLQGAVDGTRAVAEEVQQRAQTLTEQARSQVGQLFGEAKKRGRRLRHQLNDSVADVTANLQDKAKGKAEQIPGTTIDVESEAVWPEEDAESTPKADEGPAQPN